MKDDHTFYTEANDIISRTYEDADSRIREAREIARTWETRTMFCLCGWLATTVAFTILFLLTHKP